MVGIRKKISISKDKASILVPIVLIALLGLMIVNIDRIFPTPSAAAKLQQLVRDVNYTGDTTGTSPDAEITLVEFSDFQCPACQAVSSQVKMLIEHYGDKLNVVFKHFPIKSGSHKAAQASECARDQGKFWEYHDLVFANYHLITIAYLGNYAESLELNMNQFMDCVTSGEKEGKVDADFKEGYSLGIKGTPSFIVDGQLIEGGRSFEEFKRIIDPKIK